jgi:DNA polymerase elongation subunit (family B)
MASANLRVNGVEHVAFVVVDVAIRDTSLLGTGVASAGFSRDQLVGDADAERRLATDGETLTFVADPAAVPLADDAAQKLLLQQQRAWTRWVRHDEGTTAFVFGRTLDDRSVAVRVTGWQPSALIEVPAVDVVQRKVADELAARLRLPRPLDYAVQQMGHARGWETNPAWLERWVRMHAATDAWCAEACQRNGWAPIDDPDATNPHRPDRQHTYMSTRFPTVAAMQQMGRTLYYPLELPFSDDEARQVRQRADCAAFVAQGSDGPPGFGRGRGRGGWGRGRGDWKQQQQQQQTWLPLKLKPEEFRDPPPAQKFKADVGNMDFGDWALAPLQTSERRYTTCDLEVTVDLATFQAAQRAAAFIRTRAPPDVESATASAVRRRILPRLRILSLDGEMCGAFTAAGVAYFPVPQHPDNPCYLVVMAHCDTETWQPEVHAFVYNPQGVTLPSTLHSARYQTDMTVHQFRSELAMLEAVRDWKVVVDPDFVTCYNGRFDLNYINMRVNYLTGYNRDTHAAGRLPSRANAWSRFVDLYYFPTMTQADVDGLERDALAFRVRGQDPDEVADVDVERLDDGAAGGGRKTRWHVDQWSSEWWRQVEEQEAARAAKGTKADQKRTQAKRFGGSGKGRLSTVVPMDGLVLLDAFRLALELLPRKRYVNLTLKAVMQHEFGADNPMFNKKDYEYADLFRQFLAGDYEGQIEYCGGDALCPLFYVKKNKSVRNYMYMSRGTERSAADLTSNEQSMKCIGQLQAVAHEMGLACNDWDFARLPHCPALTDYAERGPFAYGKQTWTTGPRPTDGDDGGGASDSDDDGQGPRDRVDVSVATTVDQQRQQTARLGFTISGRRSSVPKIVPQPTAPTSRKVTATTTTKKKKGGSGDDDKYDGGAVLEPRRMLYTAVDGAFAADVDVNSMYPSNMIMAKTCPSLVPKRVEAVVPGMAPTPGGLPPSLLATYTLRPGKQAHIVNIPGVEGIIPKVQVFNLDEREVFKASAKRLKAQMEAVEASEHQDGGASGTDVKRQLAELRENHDNDEMYGDILKLKANSMYGLLGALSRMSCRILAEVVTFWGRNTIYDIRDICEQYARHKTVVIYGDTDSVFFISYDATTADEALAMYQELTDHINRCIAAKYGPRVQLKLEKVLVCLYMLHKKWYFCLPYDAKKHRPVAEDDMVKRGLQCIKASAFRYVAQFQRRILHLVYEFHCTVPLPPLATLRAQCRAALVEYLGRFERDEIPLDDYCQTAKLSSDYADCPTVPPHAVAWQKQRRRMPGSENPIGSKQDYVVCTDVLDDGSLPPPLEPLLWESRRSDPSETYSLRLEVKDRALTGGRRGGGKVAVAVYADTLKAVRAHPRRLRPNRQYYLCLFFGPAVDILTYLVDAADLMALFQHTSDVLQAERGGAAAGTAGSVDTLLEQGQARRRQQVDAQLAAARRRDADDALALEAFAALDRKRKRGDDDLKDDPSDRPSKRPCQE